MRVSMSEIGSVIILLLCQLSVVSCQLWVVSERRVTSHWLITDNRQLTTGLLPRTLRYARDVAFERCLTEAQPAHRKLAHVRSWPAAQLAAVAQANLVFRRLGLFGHL